MPLFVSERGSRHERIWEQIRMHLGPDADAHGMVFAKRHRIWCGEQHFPFVSDVLWYNYLKLKTGGKGYVAELEGECVAIRYNLKVEKKAINETEQRENALLLREKQGNFYIRFFSGLTKACRRAVCILNVRTGLVFSPASSLATRRGEGGNHPKPTVLYVPQYVANFVSKKSCSI